MQPQASEHQESEPNKPVVVSGEGSGVSLPNVFPPSQPINSPEPTPPPKKSRGWKIYFVFLALANIVTIAFPLLVLAWAIQQAKGGVSGTEFIGILIAPLQLAGFGVAILNVITISIFLRKKHPRKAVTIFGLVAVILSALYVGGVAITAYRDVQHSRQFNTSISKDEAISLINSCQVTSISRQDRLVLFTKHDANSQDPNAYQRYANDSDFDALKAATEAAAAKCGKIDVQDKPENYHTEDITVAKATDLLNNCKLIGFYYTQQTAGSLSDVDAEHSSTGIVLAFKEQPLRIHIADSLIPTMVPIAREAQKKCPDLQFWHDGNYEQRDANGNWR
jgi:hypothetical protein